MILFLLLLASINYQLSLGYLLAFLLASMGGTAMLHTFRNLSRLSISPGRADPVFAGGTAHFKLILANSSLPRYSVAAKRKDAEPEFADIGRDLAATVEIPVVAEHRGLLQCGRVEIFTHYPVGLFHAWSYVQFASQCLVYPKPDSAAGPLPLDAATSGAGSTLIPGEEEFHMLRAYRPGDSPRQIAWKALAREQGLLAKEFASTASTELWLDWDRFGGLAAESRLSRLCWWVLEADRLGLTFGLKIPGKSLPPSWGETHRLTCLEALALYGTGHGV